MMGQASAEHDPTASSEGQGPICSGLSSQSDRETDDDVLEIDMTSRAKGQSCFFGIIDSATVSALGNSTQAIVEVSATGLIAIAS